MSSISWRVLLAVLFAVASGGCTHRASKPAAEACDLRLVGARVVDPATRTTVARAVTVRAGRVVESESETSGAPCARTLDVSGQWILPGLVDLHVHSWGNPSPSGRDADDQEVGTEAVARLVLKAGVTTLLDLGGSEDEMLAVRDRLRATKTPLHAELFVAGPVFVERKGSRRKHGHEHDGPRFVSGPADARRQVRQLALKHPDVVKIIYDHDSFRRASMRKITMQAIVDESRRLGLKTVVHIGSWRDARDAILAGATAVTHLHDDETIPADLPALYASHQTFSIPTMAVQCDLARIMGPSGKAILDSPLLAAVATPQLLAAYRAVGAYSERALDWADWQKDFCVAHDLPSLRALFQAGVKIGTGSDSGNLGVFEGYSVHRELALMVEAGLDTYSALAAATTRAGEFLGRHYGVRAGDEANLVVVGGDPVADISNTTRVTHVIVGGELVF